MTEIRKFTMGSRDQKAREESGKAGICGRCLLERFMHCNPCQAVLM